MFTTKFIAAVASISLVVSAAEESLIRKGFRTNMKQKRQIRNNDSSNIMEDEDLAFWTRLLQDDNGKGIDDGSMSIVPSTPFPTPPSPGVSRL